MVKSEQINNIDKYENGHIKFLVKFSSISWPKITYCFNEVFINMVMCNKGN